MATVLLDGGVLLQVVDGGVLLRVVDVCVRKVVLIRVWLTSYD